jgi:hypothetical protein
MSIKFNKYNVSNTINGKKARIFYSTSARTDGREAVTLYHKDYSDALYQVFGSEIYKNDTDTMTDYFDQGRVVIFSDHPLYAQAKARADANKA